MALVQVAHRRDEGERRPAGPGPASTRDGTVSVERVDERVLRRDDDLLQPVVVDVGHDAPPGFVSNTDGEARQHGSRVVDDRDQAILTSAADLGHAISIDVTERQRRVVQRKPRDGCTPMHASVPLV